MIPSALRMRMETPPARGRDFVGLELDAYPRSGPHRVKTAAIPGQISQILYWIMVFYRYNRARSRGSDSPLRTA